MSDLIRWEGEVKYDSQLGYVGTQVPWAFQIWRHSDEDRKPWELITALPGVNDRPHASDPDELKALAGHLLRKFTSSLGALLATDLRAHLERTAGIEQELGDDYSEAPGETALELAHGHWGAAEAYREMVEHVDHELETKA